MRLNYDREILISVGTSRKDTDWKPLKISVGDLWERLKEPKRGQESQTEFFGMTKSEQDGLKDIGGFVGGSLNGGRRKATAVAGRDLVTLDLDNITSGGTKLLLLYVEMMKNAAAVYSTRKHRPEAPRLRVLIPLDRTVSPDEYGAIARRLAERLDISWADPTTFETNRLMYWPSCSADGEYVFQYWDRPLCSADEILRSYTDWRDVGSWPQAPGEKKLHERGRKQADPDTKTGVVGAFCHCYDIYAAISAFLSDVYTSYDRDPNRYTYTRGSTAGGAVVYDDGKFLYSHHATDPCSGREVNSFDLVRLHKFGDLDDEAKPGTPAHRLPSYIEMSEFAKRIPEVDALLKKESLEKSRQAFEHLAVSPVDDEALAEFTEYEGMTLSCDVVRAAMKACGYSIRRDVIVGETKVTGLPDKYSAGNAPNTLPVLLMDILKQQKIKGVTDKAITGYLGVIADENRYNPVAEMFTSTTWDGQDRLTEIYDILGSISDFEKTMVRKWCIQCVAMAMNTDKNPVNADGVLTLQGDEGLGKTELFRRLAVKPEWFAEGVTLDFQNKDSVFASINCWICELGELDSTSKKMQSALKSHLTAVSDRIREWYARVAARRPRRTSYCATVNPKDFLTGSTGNRRFWVIPISEMDLPRILKITPEWARQLWAQVYQIWQKDPSGYRLTAEERKQIMNDNRQFQVFLPGEEELLSMLDFDMPHEEWKYFTSATIARSLKWQTGQAISGQLVGKIMVRVIREYPQIEKRPGRARSTEYLLPLHISNEQ